MTQFSIYRRKAVFLIISELWFVQRMSACLSDRGRQSTGNIAESKVAGLGLRRVGRMAWRRRGYRVLPAILPVYDSDKPSRSGCHMPILHAYV